MKKIGIFVGSLRKDSFTRKVAQIVSAALPQGFEGEIIELGDLPLYNEDLENGDNVPEAWQVFRKKVAAVDGVMFFTPEYNRSVPAALKNALDVGSRPYGQSVWDDLPGAVISVSPGRLSGFGANHHLRQSLVFLNIPVMQQPEAYIGEVTALLTEDGKAADEHTQSMFDHIASSYAAWFDRTAKKA